MIKKPIYAEYGGGLGDVFNYLYRNGAYSQFIEMGPNDRATVIMMSHNPYAIELFTGHPKADQIDLCVYPYWLPHEDKTRREQYGIRPNSGLDLLPTPLKEITFYPFVSDQPFLNLVAGAPYVVIAASAGTPERQIPEDILKRICESLHRKGINTIFTGRNYERTGGRKELENIDRFGSSSVNFIDSLTVPGTCELLRNSLGIVTCHSSLAILGWHMNLPMLLLLEKNTLERHDFSKMGDWTFGLNNGRTVHSLFADYNESMQAVFELFISK